MAVRLHGCRLYFRRSAYPVVWPMRPSGPCGRLAARQPDLIPAGWLPASLSYFRQNGCPANWLPGKLTAKRPELSPAAWKPGGPASRLTGYPAAWPTSGSLATNLSGSGSRLAIRHSPCFPAVWTPGCPALEAVWPSGGPAFARQSRFPSGLPGRVYGLPVIRPLADRLLSGCPPACRWRLPGYLVVRLLSGCLDVRPPGTGGRSATRRLAPVWIPGCLAPAATWIFGSLPPLPQSGFPAL